MIDKKDEWDALLKNDHKKHIKNGERRDKRQERTKWIVLLVVSTISGISTFSHIIKELIKIRIEAPYRVNVGWFIMMSIFMIIELIGLIIAVVQIRKSNKE